MSIIDIHCHIIPGIDDGSRSPEMSMAMVGAAAASGVKAIVATPHSGRDPLSSAPVCEEILHGVSMLRRSVADAGIPVEILPGMELFANDFLGEVLLNGDYITINGSRYLLTEFDFFETPFFMEKSLEAILEAGLVPIIAHPERYRATNPGLLEKWINLGCVIQINAGSVIGLFGPSATEKAKLFLREGLVHIAASDAHSDKRRNTDFGASSERLAELVGKTGAELLLETNPRAVIRNSRSLIL